MHDLTQITTTFFHTIFYDNPHSSFSGILSYFWLAKLFFTLRSLHLLFPVPEMLLPTSHLSIPQVHMLHKSFLFSKYHFLMKVPCDALLEKNQRMLYIFKITLISSTSHEGIDYIYFVLYSDPRVCYSAW